MSLTTWIIVGTLAGSVASIVFDNPVLIGFGISFGIMFSFLWPPSRSDESSEET